jgi:hypothetical protein
MQLPFLRRFALPHSPHALTLPNWFRFRFRRLLKDWNYSTSTTLAREWETRPHSHRITPPAAADMSTGLPGAPRPPVRGGDVTSPFGRSPYFSETSPSLIGLSGFDEYTNDPKFLESHNELRDLLLTSAQSAAPTRVASPIAEEELNQQLSERLRNVSAVKSIVSTGERVMWLRNYLEEVAPWVRSLLPLS